MYIQNILQNECLFESHSVSIPQKYNEIVAYNKNYTSSEMN